ncbi:MAG: TusE/DsrC/DsvC family sulfur relay protein [bacterium]|nr:TusE/DsrC/DsvC family sulfur relay protein [bacterium]
MNAQRPPPDFPTDEPLELMEGHLADPSLWTPQVARRLAQAEEIGLNPLHWQVLWWLRRIFEEQGLPPRKKVLIQWFADHYDLTHREAHQRLTTLFPKGLLLQAGRIAGLPQGFLSCI